MSAAKSERTNQISLKQIRAKIHNELVQSRHNVNTLYFERQKNQRYSSIQEKQQNAACKRAEKLRKVKEIAVLLANPGPVNSSPCC